MFWIIVVSIGLGFVNEYPLDESIIYHPPPTAVGLRIPKPRANDL